MKKEILYLSTLSTSNLPKPTEHIPTVKKDLTNMCSILHKTQ